MKYHYCSWCCAVIVALSLHGCTDNTPPAKSTIETLSAYIRELPPGKKRTAAFMQLTNHRSTLCHFTGAQADFADKIELHQHSHHRGVMQMRKVESLPIEPGQTLSLAPGGYHLMVFGVSKPLKPDSEVTLVLTFSDCPAVTTRAKVRGLFDE